MSGKKIVFNAMVVLILGWVMASFASIETPETVQLVLINKKLDNNTDRILKIEKEINSLRTEIRQTDDIKE